MPKITQISHKNPLHTWKYYTPCYTRKAKKRLIELITHADQKTLFVGMEYKLWQETYSAVQSHYLVLTKFLKIIAPNALALTQILCLCGCLLKFWTESRFCLKSLKYPTKRSFTYYKIFVWLKSRKKIINIVCFHACIFLSVSFYGNEKNCSLKILVISKNEITFHYNVKMCKTQTKNQGKLVWYKALVSLTSADYALDNLQIMENGEFITWDKTRADSISSRTKNHGYMNQVHR